jgi:hypothetical protein
LFSDKYLENVSKSFEKIPKKDLVKYNETDLVPVCFGGIFMTRWGQLSSIDSPIKNWSVIAKGLSRGDNIEEGHYMERWWADILSWSSYSSWLLANTTSTSTSTSTSTNNTTTNRTTQILRDDYANSNSTSSTRNGNDDRRRRIIIKTAEHTIYYDERDYSHHRSAGEVLTQNEQKNVLRVKRLHMIKPKLNFLAGIIVLDTQNQRYYGGPYVYLLITMIILFVVNRNRNRN